MAKLEVDLSNIGVSDLTQAMTELRFANREAITLPDMLETLVDEYKWDWDAETKTASKTIDGELFGLRQTDSDGIQMILKEEAA